MLLTEFHVDVFDLVFDDLRIAEAGSIDHSHALLDHVWVCRVAHFKQAALLHAEHTIVGVYVGHNEIEEITSAFLLEPLSQLVQTESER